MKLYYHPASTTCRPIELFAAESGIPLQLELVDIFTGEQYQSRFESVNPSHLVPVLEDGDFSQYPNVRRWLGRMKSLGSWKKVNEAIDGYAASLEGTPMLAV